MRSIIRVLCCLAPVYLSGFAWADDGDGELDRSERGNWAVGVPVSTLGAGAEIAVRVHPNLVIRATGTFGDLPWAVDSIRFSTSTSNYGQGSTKYNLSDFSISSGRAILDWHLFRDGARLSVGASYFDYEAGGNLAIDNAPNASVIRIGDTNYAAAAVSNVAFTVKSKSSIVPYFGFGYDSSFFKSYGFSISTDFGVLYGIDHEVALTGGTGISAADRAKEEKTISDKLPNLYPVISIAAKYRF